MAAAIILKIENRLYSFQTSRKAILKLNAKCQVTTAMQNSGLKTAIIENPRWRKAPS
jgi:hypothetical protein